ncbi:hypothetical protein QU481_03835 [Crenobacter sp. SG2303]|uniref:Uncharacterized protein n=1 Tax=Crenobacter oryzisoli TaxID=3056844 RepID=A0ABT7XKC1_9NEIS|nr:hypothetical protein [Crenobacter sp. SG2303]MDN0074019.1 hypothetical protein [Crenobacter sp. SG2303]
MNQLKTVNQFSEAHPAFTPAALRGLIFKANPRITHEGEVQGNGLIEAGAIVRLGRRILIDEAKFFNWVEQQQHTRMA